MDLVLQATHVLVTGALAPAPEVRDARRRDVERRPGPRAGGDSCRRRARQLLPTHPGAPTGQAVPVVVRAKHDDLREPEPRRRVEPLVVSRKVVVPGRRPPPRPGDVVVGVVGRVGHHCSGAGQAGVQGFPGTAGQGTRAPRTAEGVRRHCSAALAQAVGTLPGRWGRIAARMGHRRLLSAQGNVTLRARNGGPCVTIPWGGPARNGAAQAHAGTPPCRASCRGRRPRCGAGGPAAARGVGAHLRVLTSMNHDSQDQRGLPVRWCCETITTIFRRLPCWSSAMIPGVLSSHKRSPL